MAPDQRWSWFGIVAVPSLALTALNIFVVVLGPAPLVGRVDASFEHGVMHVRSVEPGSPPAQAGVRAGDDVLSVDGVPLETRKQWSLVRAHLSTHRPSTWHVRRDGAFQVFSVVSPRVGLAQRLDVATVAYLVGMLTFVLLGTFLAARRPADATARAGALLFMCGAVNFGSPDGWAELLRQLPVAVQWLVWIPRVSRGLLGPMCLSFFAMFPRRRVWSRWFWCAIWLPTLLLWPWDIRDFIARASRDPGMLARPVWLEWALPASLTLYITISLLLLIANFRGLTDPNDRRRIRVFAFGSSIGIGAFAYFVWTSAVDSTSRHGTGSEVLVPLLVLACPLTLSYTIVRYRVLDIEVIVRRGLQYALARRAILALVPVLVAVVLADLTINRQRPLTEIVQARGWLYAAVASLGLVAYFQREQWLEWLDRRFFREHYDSMRVLHEIRDELRSEAGLDAAGMRVVTRIEAALHPTFASLMTRDAAGIEFQSLASAPAGQACPPIRTDSALLALLTMLEKPLRVLANDSRRLQSRLPLPADEAAFVSRARLDVLVPIVVADQGLEAFLALGIKRSEEPYNGEDVELLEEIAIGLARLFQRGAHSPAISGTFAECPHCGECVDDDDNADRCRADGAALEKMPFSRVLAGRYQLEQRRGAGGMGRVYAATDRALGRRVAVKIAWPNGSGVETATRLPAEARSAAMLSHPNVVTIYDYGLNGDNFGFIVMELLEGCTLRHELTRCGTLSASRTLGILGGVCAALDAAHLQGLIHRDLKPENIFLARAADRSTETVKVLDFGLAKLIGSSPGDEAAPQLPGTPEARGSKSETQSGTLLGTRGYLSPERLKGDEPTTSWDLWALAVLAYEMLTGSLPFAAGGFEELPGTAWGHGLTPEHGCSSAPHRTRALFERAFGADRAGRFESASAFLDGLKESLS